MTDRISKEDRTRNMSAVRSKGNKTTEQTFLKLLKENKITGWRRHYKIVGTPDFVFLKQKIAVFVDGCFWHGCKCKTIPETNTKFWKDKIDSNKKRDKKVDSELKARGWIVVRIWEHQITKRPASVINKLKKIVEYKHNDPSNNATQASGKTS